MPLASPLLSLQASAPPLPAVQASARPRSSVAAATVKVYEPHPDPRYWYTFLSLSIHQYSAITRSDFLDLVKWENIIISLLSNMNTVFLRASEANTTSATMEGPVNSRERTISRS